jgi:hypothetical protein
VYNLDVSTRILEFEVEIMSDITYILILKNIVFLICRYIEEYTFLEFLIMGKQGKKQW